MLVGSADPTRLTAGELTELILILTKQVRKQGFEDTVQIMRFIASDCRCMICIYVSEVCFLDISPARPQTKVEISLQIYR